MKENSKHHHDLQQTLELCESIYDELNPTLHTKSDDEI